MIEIQHVAEVVVETNEANVNQDLAAGYILLAVSSGPTGFAFLLGTDQPPAPAAPAAPAA